MNSSNSSTFRSPIFSIDLNEVVDHDHHHFFTNSKPLEAAATPAAASSSSSISYPINFINQPHQDGGGFFNTDSNLMQPHDEAKIYVWHGGSCDHPKLKRTTAASNDDGLTRNEYQNQSENNSSAAKWMSSKMRLMRKMMSPDQAVAAADTPPEPNLTQKLDSDHINGRTSASQTVGGTDNSSSNTNNATIRVCSDCNTTKTPLWRSGPRGPKSLCNACGIRQRKARRAMAAAAAAAAAAASTSTTSGSQVFNEETPAVKTTTGSKVQQKEKKTNNNNNNNSHLPFKKRCKFTTQGRGRKKFGFEDLTIILSKNSAYHQRVFPQDEKEAAILLMALSYGLVHG